MAPCHSSSEAEPSAPKRIISVAWWGPGRPKDSQLGEPFASSSDLLGAMRSYVLVGRRYVRA